MYALIVVLLIVVLLLSFYCAFRLSINKTVETTDSRWLFEANSKLQQENTQLKLEEAQIRHETEELKREAERNRDFVEPLTRENIMHYLSEETSIPPELSPGGEFIQSGGLSFDLRRLPYQVFLTGVHNLQGVEIDYNVLREVLAKVEHDMVLLKCSFDPKESWFSFRVICCDEFLGPFKRHFNFYVGLIKDADRFVKEEYARRTDPSKNPFLPESEKNEQQPDVAKKPSKIMS